MKKQNERQILEGFRQSFPGFPAGDIEESESPDFIVRTATRRIGIEITRVYHPEMQGNPPRPMQAHESLEDAIIRQAEAIYTSQGGPPVTVHINLSPHMNLGRAQVSELAARLAAIVRQSVIAANPTCFIQNRWHPEDQLPDELVSISAFRSDQLKESHWTTSRAGWVWFYKAAEIQSVLDEKTRKYGTYRSKCDELWLLIAALGETPATFVELAEGTSDQMFTCPFNRVFFFRAVYRCVEELKISSTR